jgi:hypothetical protein
MNCAESPARQNALNKLKEEKSRMEPRTGRVKAWMILVGPFLLLFLLIILGLLIRERAATSSESPTEPPVSRE